jgi:hypothetical protein
LLDFHEPALCGIDAFGFSANAVMMLANRLLKRLSPKFAVKTSSLSHEDCAIVVGYDGCSKKYSCRMTDTCFRDFPSIYHYFASKMWVMDRPLGEG